MKRPATKTKPATEHSTKTNTLRRRGQTMTVVFDRKRSGPSVKMLFEEADLRMLSETSADDDAP